MKATITRLVVFLLGVLALTCLGIVGESAWLRHRVHRSVKQLTSPDRSSFSAAYGDLAYDSDARITGLILEALESNPPRDLRYQLVRVLYTRLGIHYAPEESRLPSNAELRALAHEREKMAEGETGR